MNAWSQRWAGRLAAGAAILVAGVVVGVVRPGGTSVHAATGGGDTVTVTGIGTADAAPDTLTVDFTVHVTRPGVQEALDAQASAVRHVLDALKAAGIPRDRTQTTDLSLDRHYDDHGVVAGYDANETVRAKVQPLTHAGAVISRAATSAGNAVEVGDIAFDLTNDAAVVTSARVNAFDDARSTARQYAALSGRSLGRVEKVTEVVDATPQPITYDQRAGLLDAAGSGAKSAVPLRSGQQTLTVRVNVTWSLV
ncbi:MAG TPA: SIMPL domain-containing protein [Mycobacteriales bacterium]|nr:SIMPL domain-containing protein [Mycobacteriales bacterium]